MASNFHPVGYGNGNGYGNGYGYGGGSGDGYGNGYDYSDGYGSASPPFTAVPYEVEAQAIFSLLGEAKWNV